jgi:eukaryotic-like serine/threonine-protein kinase
VKPSAPIAEKRAGWALEDEAVRLDRRIALLQTRYVEGLHGVLVLDPELPAARDRLADHYLAQWEAAESAGDATGAEQAAFLVRHHDRGRHAARLAAEATLVLATDPPGAVVHLERYVEVDRALRPEPARTLGTTPLVDVPVGPGSWRLRIVHPACHEVILPILARRGQRVEDVRPGETAPRVLPLPPLGTLGPDERYVPSGWFDAGGDPEAPDALPASRWWIEGFSMRVTHVTNAEYAAFLDAIPEDEALGLADGAFVRCEDGWRATPQLTGKVPGQHLPVVLVDWRAAHTYATWRAKRDALSWRLPHDLEWEKAARGADRRIFPWGNAFDATFTRMLTSLPGPTEYAAVGMHPVDEGPYGHRDLAGNVRDWCSNGYSRSPVRPRPNETDGPLRIARGGAMTSGPAFCRSAGRTAASEDTRVTLISFRLARSWPTR